jgi:hypothetical protein
MNDIHANKTVHLTPFLFFILLPADSLFKDDVIDDFMFKKMGNGEVFYGKRKSILQVGRIQKEHTTEWVFPTK